MIKSAPAIPDHRVAGALFYFVMLNDLRGYLLFSTLNNLRGYLLFSTLNNP